MKKVYQIGVIISISIFFFGCPYSGYEYPTGHFPDNPINFSEVNTAYNDYNISSPELFSERHFHFSSDRKTSGSNFDIIGENFTIIWDKENGIFQCNSSESSESELIADILQSVNTPSDELGPYSLFYLSSDDLLSFVMFFSRTTDGVLDIFFVTAAQGGDNIWEVGDIVSCKSINSDANDGYISFLGAGLTNQSYGVGNSISAVEHLYFCSDKDGDFDIYEMTIPQNSDVLSYLEQTAAGLDTKNSVLSSNGDDKCPFLNNNVMVFTSNRDGGYGGFDLYYSIMENGEWSEPTNFGDNINTEYDEYRPIILYDDEFDNDVIFFSSNRPGGKGMFDIYYCGVPSLVDENLQ